MASKSGNTCLIGEISGAGKGLCSEARQHEYMIGSVMPVNDTIAGIPGGTYGSGVTSMNIESG